VTVGLLFFRCACMGRLVSGWPILSTTVRLGKPLAVDAGRKHF
jgi:hypothetical protein